MTQLLYAHEYITTPVGGCICNFPQSCTREHHIHLLTTRARLYRSSLWPHTRYDFGRAHCDLIGDVATMVKRTVKSATAHPYIAVFELSLPLVDRMMSWKFRDDISNGSRVIVLKNKQTHKRTLLKTMSSSLRCAARVVIIIPEDLPRVNKLPGIWVRGEHFPVSALCCGGSSYFGPTIDRTERTTIVDVIMAKLPNLSLWSLLWRDMAFLASF